MYIMYVHTLTYTSGPFFILEITGTTKYQLVIEGYVIVQWHFACESLYRLIYLDS